MDEQQSSPETPRTKRKKYGGRTLTLQKIPPELYEKMLECVRLGAYDHVAAGYLGVNPSTFIRWMREGEQAKSGIFRQLYNDVMQARMHARMLAEARVYNEDPKFWLQRVRHAREDWADGKTQVEFSGGIGVSGQIDHEHNINDNRPTAVPQLAQALAVLQQLHILPEASEEGRQLLAAIDAKSEEVDENEKKVDSEKALSQLGRSHHRNNGNGSNENGKSH